MTNRLRAILLAFLLVGTLVIAIAPSASAAPCILVYGPAHPSWPDCVGRTVGAGPEYAACIITRILNPDDPPVCNLEIPEDP